MVSRHWLYFFGFVMAGLLSVGTGVLAILESVSVLFGPPTDAFVLSAMLGAAAEWIALSVVLAVLTILLLVGTVVSFVRSLSFPRNEKLAALFNWIERKHPAFEQFGVSNRFEPTAEDRKQQLKEQYVEGEISELEFERQMDQLMDDTVPEKTSRRPEPAFELEEESR